MSWLTCLRTASPGPRDTLLLLGLGNRTLPCCFPVPPGLASRPVCSPGPEGPPSRATSTSGKTVEVITRSSSPVRTLVQNQVEESHLNFQGYLERPAARSFLVMVNPASLGQPFSFCHLQLLLSVNAMSFLPSCYVNMSGMFLAFQTWRVWFALSYYFYCPGD